MNKLVVEKQYKCVEAKDVIVGNLAKAGSGKICYRTEKHMVFFENHCVVPVEKCYDYYEDLGPFRVEYKA